MEVRKELGGVGGALPASDVIAFSVDSERDAHAFAQTFAPGDERAIASFVELWRRAQAKAMQVCRRRVEVSLPTAVHPLCYCHRPQTNPCLKLAPLQAAARIKIKETQKENKKL